MSFKHQGLVQVQEIWAGQLPWQKCGFCHAWNCRNDWVSKGTQSHTTSLVPRTWNKFLLCISTQFRCLVTEAWTDRQGQALSTAPSELYAWDAAAPYITLIRPVCLWGSSLACHLNEDWVPRMLWLCPLPRRLHTHKASALPVTVGRSGCLSSL